MRYNSVSSQSYTPNLLILKAKIVLENVSLLTNSFPLLKMRLPKKTALLYARSCYSLFFTCPVYMYIYVLTLKS